MAVGKQWELPSPTPVSLQLSQQSRCPDFFLFLCRLLSPLLKAFAQAATFLHQGRLPDTGEACASPAIHRGRLRVLGMGSACGGPGSGLLWPAELGYVEQLFQFLQATAQEDGFFGESQAASVGSWEAGGFAGGCCPLLGSARLTPGKRAAERAFRLSQRFLGE